MAMIMLVLGLLLLAAAIVLIVAVVVKGTDVVAVEVFDVGLDTTIWGVFVGGVATGVIVLAGLAALKLGIQRIRPRRAHHRRRRGRRRS
jgi:hypothetical protein